jgi:hypothetical protein
VLLVVHQNLVTTEGQWHQEIADPRRCPDQLLCVPSRSVFSERLTSYDL